MSAIEDTLRTKFGIDDFYYLGISIELDVPGGMKGEIEANLSLLKDCEFKPNVTNLSRIMKAKKRLMTFFDETDECKRQAEKYRKILQFARPVGTAIPIDLYIAYLVAATIAYIVSKFLGSFMEESGKIAAKKLLDKQGTKRDITLTVNISDSEYDLMRDFIPYLLSKDPSIEELFTQLEKE